jgi:cation/acetate symporter
MNAILAIPQPTPVDNTWAAPLLATVLAVVLAAVVFAMVIPIRRRIRDTGDFLLAGRKIGVGQNTLAMVGSGLMYSTVIIIAGHVSLNGFDAIMLLTAFTMSTVLAVLIYASPARNVGGYTIGDIFALRVRQRTARATSAVLTLTIYAMFMVAVLASIGLAASRMFTTAAKASTPFVALVIVLAGLVAILLVYLGGMQGITRMLALKVVLFTVVIAVMTVMVMAKYNMNPFQLLDDAAAHAAPNPRGGFLDPGRLFGEGATFHSGQDPWVHLSKIVSVTAGVIGMPFLFTRFLVASGGPDARKSAGWASMIAVTFYQFIIIVSLGATAMLGSSGIGKAWDTRDITLPKLAEHLGGKTMSGILGAVAMLSVVAIFGVLLLNAVTSYAKDVNVLRGRQLEPAAELREVRRNVLVIGIISLVGGLALAPILTHVFIPTSIDLGATCVLPAIVYSLFWRRFNTRGLQWTVYGGLAAVMLMVLFSNGITGDPANAMFPDIDFKVVDFEPGLLGLPIGFLLGLVGTLTSPERDDAGFAQMRVRSLTGAVIPARTQRPATLGADVPIREDRTPSEAH